MAEKADYRLISQEYGQGAIKAAVLLNSGAAVAVMSQLDGLHGFMDVSDISRGILFFVAGVVVGAITWLVAFLSTRYVDQKNEGERDSNNAANIAMYGAILLVLISLAMFAWGCSHLAISISSQ